MTNTIRLILPLLIFTQITIGQKNFFKEAEFMFKQDRVYRATDAYKKAYSSSRKVRLNGVSLSEQSAKAYISYKLALCYVKYNEPSSAEQYFERAEKLQYQVSFGDSIYLDWAENSIQQANYQKAQNLLKKYVNQKSNTRATKLNDMCSFALDQLANPTRYKVSPEKMMNSEHYDFAPFYASNKYDEMYFTSNRPGNDFNKSNDIIGGQNKDIWFAKLDNKGHWGQPELLNNGINTEHDEGVCAINKKGNLMVFTRCAMDKKKSYGCDLYLSIKSGRNWGKPELIKFKSDGQDSLAIRHPSISSDGKTLYFSANIPGGYGGYDLYKSEYDKREKNWSEPENLGASINTKGNEVFPYLRNSKELYLVTDGRIGMGGMDIYKSVLENGNWSEPQNLGSPINSQADDFGIIFEGSRERGYFTSNRSRENKDDIYRFNLPSLVFDLSCYVMFKDSNNPVANAQIQLIGSDNTNNLYQTDENGFMNLNKLRNGKQVIQPNVNYTLIVEKKGEVLRNQQAFTTLNLNKSKHFIYEFLVPNDADPIKLPEVRYDFAKSFLQVNDSVNSKDSLNFVYNKLIENPSIIVQLRSHTDCRGEFEFNGRLSVRRAKACVRYLVEEKGIDPRRLIPVGMGESEPLPGLSEQEIQALPTEEEREAAHQRNRRTDMKIQSWDFISDK